MTLARGLDDFTAGMKTLLFPLHVLQSRTLEKMCIMKERSECALTDGCLFCMH